MTEPRPEQPSPLDGLDALSEADTPAGGVLIAETGAHDSTEGATVPADRPPLLSRGLRSLLEWVAVITVALVVALAIRTWVFQPFWIPSGSMQDTLDIDDRVLVNKLSYRLHDIHRGDVVVFEQPDSWPLGADVKDLIKRVIGLPGDEVEIKDCSVFIDGRRLVEPYTDGQCTRWPEPSQARSSEVDPDGDGRFVVPADHIFVMGDNRNGSDDSRMNGYVPESDVVGRAFVVIWPKGHWRWL